MKKKILQTKTREDKFISILLSFSDISSLGKKYNKDIILSTLFDIFSMDQRTLSFLPCPLSRQMSLNSGLHHITLIFFSYLCITFFSSSIFSIFSFLCVLDLGTYCRCIQKKFFSGNIFKVFCLS